MRVALLLVKFENSIHGAKPKIEVIHVNDWMKKILLFEEGENASFKNLLDKLYITENKEGLNTHLQQLYEN